LGLISREVKVKWGNRNKTYYISKGYLYTKNGNEFLVKIEDLTNKNDTEVKIKCDNCSKTLNIKWCNYKKSVKEDGKYYCKSCANKLYGSAAQTRSTKQDINDQCKLYNLSIELIGNYIKNNIKSEWRCLECDKIFKRSWSSVQQGQTSCPHCGDGISYPEKFGRNVFEQLGMNYITEYTSFWTHNFKYDFGFKDQKIVVEFHGIQHYKKGFETCGGRTIKEEQENDKNKKELAELNGYKYVAIDCGKSEMEWIKNSILDSELNIVFDLSKIDWFKCHEIACKSFKKKAWDLWNDGINSTAEIGGIMKLSYGTVSRYLKEGAKIKKCDYNPKDVMKNINKKNIGKFGNPVVQISLDNNFIAIFSNAHEAMRQTEINHSKISACCRKERNKTGGYKWMLKSDWETIQNEIQLS
jgi:Zn finger protein HypA/HybF involved in hydrogenase expression